MSPIRTERINHPALIAADVEETIRFYTEVLGMELVLRQPNLDDPDSEHLFFDAGGDTFIAFFGPRPGLPPNRVRAQPGVGYMMHLAFDVDEQTFEQAQDELKRRGIRFSGPVDRGYERSIYFRDPNGIVLELLTWVVPRPRGIPQSRLIRRAQEIRTARGAPYIQAQDIQQAIAELAGPVL